MRANANTEVDDSPIPEEFRSYKISTCAAAADNSRQWGYKMVNEGYLRAFRPRTGGLRVKHADFVDFMNWWMREPEDR